MLLFITMILPTWEKTRQQAKQQLKQLTFCVLLPHLPVSNCILSFFQKSSKSQFIQVLKLPLFTTVFCDTLIQCKYTSTLMSLCQLKESGPQFDSGSTTSWKRAPSLWHCTLPVYCTAMNSTLAIQRTTSLFTQNANLSAIWQVCVNVIASLFTWKITFTSHWTARVWSKPWCCRITSTASKRLGHMKPAQKWFFYIHC